MILNIQLRNKMESWEYNRCQIDKTIELSHTEFEHFRRNTLADYDFIRNSLDDLPTTNDNTRHCIMLLDDGGDDGILVDPQGYDYARYSEYVPNARQLCRLGQFPALEEMTADMERLVDYYTKQALETQSEGKTTLLLSDVSERYEATTQGFLDYDLFTNMLAERPEFDDVEENCGDLFITVNLQYERVHTREISPRELEVICAKHTLWLNDAGGGQADFSNCHLKGLSLYGKDLSNSRCEFAVFEDCNLQSVDFSNAEMETARFDGCFMQDIFANKTNFLQANFTNCDISNSVITDSLLTSAAMNHCKVENSQITKCQIEGFKYLETDMSKAACFDSQPQSETNDMKLS
ncbi:DUF6329 domain-containing protein [Ruminococcus sp. zg-924]|uniref:DUF6329 domain-containing protein n=1 Tax=Ruminococcus sp. zg-924 TaxID=2678505 RepID=UPI00210AC4F2|nr:DUF6329 domain-containing protein [Ruminococcus sp. zg-924]MCQ4022847.1 hypothetical protein [Ruminococcus sp. zg-924]